MSTTGTPTYPLGTIAKLLMMTERRVNQLSADGVIPKAERGRYELAPAVQGYIRFLQDRTIRGGGGITAIDYHVEKGRLTKAQADVAELEVATARGDVALIREFERAQSMAMAAIRANVMNVPTRAVMQLLGCTDETEFKEKLRAELMLALETAANTDLEPPADEDDDECKPDECKPDEAA